jgi:hypothetical protein
MKTKILSLAILALGAAFNAFAQDAAADLNPAPGKSVVQQMANDMVGGDWPRSF